MTKQEKLVKALETIAALPVIEGAVSDVAVKIAKEALRVSGNVSKPKK